MGCTGAGAPGLLGAAQMLCGLTGGDPARMHGSHEQADACYLRVGPAEEWCGGK